MAGEGASPHPRHPGIRSICCKRRPHSSSRARKGGRRKGSCPGRADVISRSGTRVEERVFRSGVYSGVDEDFPSFLRKEVIQPQVPLRLPCYDLVPITGFIFGACLSAPATSDAPRFGGLTGGVYKAQEHIHRGMLIRDY